MPTSASPLELRFNLSNEFAFLPHVTLAFKCGVPMMPRLDAADADMCSLLHAARVQRPRVCAAEDHPPCSLPSLPCLRERRPLWSLNLAPSGPEAVFRKLRDGRAAAWLPGHAEEE